MLVDRLAEELQARGHRVRCFSYSPRPEHASYEHVRLRPHDRRSSAAARLTLVPMQLNFLDTSGLDVMHLHGDDWLYLRRRLPTVRTFHGSAFHEALHADGIKRRIHMLAVAPGELLAGRLATAAYGVTPGHPKGFGLAGTLPNGFDLAGDAPEHREGPPSILCIGTWGGRKRGRLLHELFLREVKPRVPDAELWMVSDHCEEGPGVIWHKRPSDDEVVSLLRRAWTFCLPSEYEGFGIPYLEAMAARVPVVATSNPGARNLLEDGRVGMIVRDEDIGAALVGLLQDPALRARMGAAGRERAKDFTWDRVIEAHERAYDDAIARVRSRKEGSHPGAR